MSDWVSGLEVAPWAPVLAAYLFGAATGWLIWGFTSAATSDDEDAATATSKDAVVEATARRDVDDLAEKAPVPDSMKLGALESELRRARELLAEAGADDVDYTSRLDELDAGLKRANGRLKLLLRSALRTAF
ncbi:MAG: hypothetical protein AAGJ87_13675, partial [Pseudomonadota bacterium]